MRILWLLFCLFIVVVVLDIREWPERDLASGFKVVMLLVLMVLPLIYLPGD